jgi:RNA polymerase primary sigma factor
MQGKLLLIKGKVTMTTVMNRGNDSGDGYQGVDVYIKDVNRVCKMTNDQEAKLVERLKLDPNDEEAKTALVEGSLALPTYLAKKYIGCGLPYIDLIQEGNVGLLNAIKTYDPNKGVRFFTYATTAVRWSIFLAIGDKSRIVRIPVGMRRFSTDIRKGKKVAKKDLEKKMKFLNITSDREMSFISMYRTLSINPKSTHGTSNVVPTLVDFLNSLEDKNSSEELKKVDYAIDNGRLAHALNDVMDVLPTDERKIVELHYGINGNCKHTFKEIGEMLGVTPQDVFPKNKRALNRLSEFKDRLEEYV